MTAAHVIDDTATIREGGRLAVLFSDGMPLGTPRTVIRGATREISVSGFDLVENDIAVIEISSFYQLISARPLPLALRAPAGAQ